MDPATVIFMLAAQLIGSALLLWLVSQRMPPRSGLATWAAAFGLFGIAYLGRLASGLDAPAPMGFPTDVAMVAALLLFDRGLRQFFGRDMHALPIVRLVAGYALLHGMVVFALGTQARFVELNATIGVLYLALTRHVLHERARLDADDLLRRPMTGLAGMMVTIGVLSLVRAGLVAEGGIGLLYRGAFAQLFFGVSALVAVLVAMMTLWMVFIRLNRQLAELASHDALTRVLNRNGLDDALQRHFASRPQRRLTLLIVDLDHFKSVNDRYGHAAGDAMLRAVADAIVAQLRGSDFIARVGGEEFIVGCGDADEAEALALAERLRQRIGELEVREPGGSATLRCTVSIGISQAFCLAGQFELAARAADRALYAAKQRGRDRVEAVAPT